jgi:putative membrane protein
MDDTENPLDKAKRRGPGLLLRGLCMGTADVIPGVSGGTVALIMGI